MTSNPLSPEPTMSDYTDPLDLLPDTPESREIKERERKARRTLKEPTMSDRPDLDALEARIRAASEPACPKCKGSGILSRYPADSRICDQCGGQGLNTNGWFVYDPATILSLIAYARRLEGERDEARLLAKQRCVALDAHRKALLEAQEKLGALDEQYTDEVAASDVIEKQLREERDHYRAALVECADRYPVTAADLERWWANPETEESQT